MMFADYTGTVYLPKEISKYIVITVVCLEQTCSEMTAAVEMKMKAGFSQFRVDRNNLESISEDL